MPLGLGLGIQNAISWGPRISESPILLSHLRCARPRKMTRWPVSFDLYMYVQNILRAVRPEVWPKSQSEIPK